MKYVLAYVLTLLLALTAPVFAASKTDQIQSQQIQTLTKIISQQNRWIFLLRNQMDEVIEQFVAIDANGDIVGPAFLRSDETNWPFPVFWVYLEEYDVLLKPGYNTLYFTDYDCTGNGFIIAPPSLTTVNGPIQSPTAVVNNQDIWAPIEYQEDVITLSAYQHSNNPEHDGCHGDLTRGGSYEREGVDGFLFEAIAPWTYQFPLHVEMR